MPEPEPPHAVVIEAGEACHLCGHPAAIVVDGKAWCASCVHARGSCCAESEIDEG